MPPADWNRVKEIFSAALGVPDAERDGYLELACADQPEIRAAVDELVRAHQDASQGFLEPHRIVFRTAWLFQVGDRVADRFVVVKPIARGAMGEVYQVYDERLRLQVALKAIRPELIGDIDTVERFKREVRVTREIAHEGLCRVFDLVEHPLSREWGHPEGTVVPCLTMQLLEGTTLEDWLTKQRPLELKAALRLIRQIAEALHVLHTAGVMHRDLKPSNVMLLSDLDGPRAVLTDFGLARPLDEGLFKTQGRFFGGAPYFMAPELLRGERPSLASDIYALGLLIDEMVTRTRAFSADSLPGLMLQKLDEGPTHPSLRSDGLPKSWERTILRCLAADPHDRFSTARAVVAALDPAGRWWARRWRDALRPWYFPRQWRVATYFGAAVLALSGVMSLTAPLSEPPRLSIIVGPFSNLTGRPENDYLSAGTASELGRRLSSLEGWLVYVPKEQWAKDPAQALFEIKGHVQEVDRTLRIAVELTDTRSATLLWSRRFDGSRDNALALEDQLASAALTALKNAARRDDGSALSRAVTTLARTWRTRGSAQLPRYGTSNNEAYDAYLRARYLAEARNLKTTLPAIDLFLKATTLDPDFAAAYAGLADAQSTLMEQSYAPHDQLLAKREEYATRAVELEPNLPEAQLALAAVRQMQSRWEEAKTAYERALALHPKFARAKRSYGGMLLQFGQYKEAVDLCQQALELDPHDVPNSSAHGLVLFYARRPLDAAAHLEKLLAQKDYPNAHFILGQVYSQLAAIAPAARAEYLKKALQESEVLRQQKTPAYDRFADLVGALAWSYQGDLNQAQPFLHALEAGRDAGPAPASFRARVYAVQKRPADAMAALLAAEAEHARELMYLRVSPLWDSIRDEPEFQALMKRLKLI